MVMLWRACWLTPNICSLPHLAARSGVARAAAGWRTGFPGRTGTHLAAPLGKTHQRPSCCVTLDVTPMG